MAKELQQARLKQGYFVVLIIMIAMTTLSSVVAVNLIIDQEHDSRNINISGMQRMLSQKIALHAVQISSLDSPQSEYARKRMLASAIRFLENHKVLIGEQSNPNLSERIASLYFDPKNHLDLKFKKFASDAIAYSNGSDFETQWLYSTQDIEQLLLELDGLVTLYEEVASHNVASIFFIELGIWLINLIIIICAYVVLVKRAYIS